MYLHIIIDMSCKRGRKSNHVYPNLTSNTRKGELSRKIKIAVI